MSDHLQKSVRMPGWDGAKKTYQEFSLRFHAFAMYHGFVKAIGLQADPHLPSEETDADDGCTQGAKLIEITSGKG